MEQQHNNQNMKKFFSGSWKLIAGIILLIVGWTSNEFLLSILGICLLIMHFAESRRKAASQQQESKPEETAPEHPEEEPAFFQAPETEYEPSAEEWTCEKCGAPNKGAVCEYCGTPRGEQEQ